MPADDTVIWRFMTPAKFLSLLTKSSIYFCQALKLRSVDPFEGTLPGLNRAFYELMMNSEEFARRFMRLGPTDPLPHNYREVFSPAWRKRLNDVFASTAYVNCWNMNEFESAFLWSIYAPVGEGVAIRSTVGRLKNSIAAEKRDIYIGPIIYLDYTSESIDESNSFNVFFRKRKSFEAERELRACFLNLLEGVGWSEEALTRNPGGLHISCDLSALIEKIFISPAAPDWYFDALTDTLQKMGYRFPITKSSLSDPAVF